MVGLESFRFGLVFIQCYLGLVSGLLRVGLGFILGWFRPI